MTCRPSDFTRSSISPAPPWPTGPPNSKLSRVGHHRDHCPWPLQLSTGIHMHTHTHTYNSLGHHTTFRSENTLVMNVLSTYCRYNECVIMMQTKYDMKLAIQEKLSEWETLEQHPCHQCEYSLGGTIFHSMIIGLVLIGFMSTTVQYLTEWSKFPNTKKGVPHDTCSHWLFFLLAQGVGGSLQGSTTNVVYRGEQSADNAHRDVHSHHQMLPRPALWSKCVWERWCPCVQVWVCACVCAWGGVHVCRVVHVCVHVHAWGDVWRCGGVCVQVCTGLLPVWLVSTKCRADQPHWADVCTCGNLCMCGMYLCRGIVHATHAMPPL